MNFSRWAFRFLLWYICILIVQPQNRFQFLWPLHIANLSVIAAVVLHLFSALLERKPLIRFGTATVMAALLLLAGFTSLLAGPLQTSSAWNPWIDILTKNAIVLVLVEAMCTTIERVWIVQATILLGSLWWVKAGLRLSTAGATFASDRLMGPAVGLVENPNSFAYMMCVILPLYLYFYQQTKPKKMKMLFLGLALATIFIVLETGSRTGFLVLVFLGLFLFPKYGSEHKVAIIIAGVALFIILPLVGAMNIERFKSIPQSIGAFFTGEVKEIDELTQDQQSAQERRLKNRDTWSLIKEYPLFGVGINADESLFQGRFPLAVGQVHCEILMAGRQMGVVGMALYVAFLVLLYRFGQHVQRFAAYRFPVLSDLGWTFKMQSLVFLVGGAFSPLPWNPLQLILVGGASALWINVRELAVQLQPVEAFVDDPVPLESPEAPASQEQVISLKKS